MRKSKIIMGTGVTLDIPEAKNDLAFRKVFNKLEQIDSKFSTYKLNSEVSRFRRGEIKQWRLSRDLKKIIKACASSEVATDGAFSAWADGTFDPSGYVKGWAIEEVSKLIEKSGYKSFCLSIGGDINARGHKTWRIGIQNPKNSSSIVATINAKNIAIATSGNYERGPHITNPKTGEPAESIQSITVIGPKIIDADVLSTAGFVLGDFGLNFIGGQATSYEALVIDNNYKIHMTSGMSEYLEP